MEVSDFTGPGLETSILEEGQDTDGPASVERRVSHRGAVDSRGQVAWAWVRGRTFPLEASTCSTHLVLPPTPQSWQL